MEPAFPLPAHQILSITNSDVISCMTDNLTLMALHHIPLIHPGDDLSVVIINALQENNMVLQDGDKLVLAQKIVSKATGRIVDLRQVTPGKHALALARKTDKDPRLVEVILGESNSVLQNIAPVGLWQMQVLMRRM
jgi:coenzyme F420-0:L-glutamate ligase/coenzyme F420-1:gamma-L-glutamate ligase